MPPEATMNVRLDLTITDTYTDTPAVKTVTMLLASGESSMIRTSNVLPNGFQVELNVDANVNLFQPDTIRVRVTFEYTPAQMELGGVAPPVEGQLNRDGRIRPAQLNESLTVWLKDGVPLMVSQSADPATDRKVSVELKATVVK